MAVQFQNKGKPLAIREQKTSDGIMYLVEFEEISKAQPPKGLPKPGALKSIALMNLKQLKKLYKTIASNGDDLETMNEVLIKGEILTDVASLNADADVFFVTYEVMYIPLPEGKEPNEQRVSVDIDMDTLLQSLEVPKKKDTPAIPKEIEELHKQLDGVCPSCGQKCDKKAIRLVKTEEASALCMDCAEGRGKPDFIPETIFLKQFLGKTEMDEKEAISYLSAFPKEFVFVEYNEKHQNRVYWSWQQEQSVRHLYTEKDGLIVGAVLRDGSVIQGARKTSQPSTKEHQESDNSKKVEEVRVKEFSYKKIAEEEVFLLEMHIPKDFVQKKPRDEKIQEKINFYQRNGAFPKPIVLLQNEQGYMLIDGYSAYMAAQELGLLKAHAVLVRPFKPKGGKQFGFKNQSNRKTEKNEKSRA